MFRLPDGWSKPIRLEDVVVIGGVKIHRSGVAATAPSGEEICGAAADRARSARDRAWFELAERVCALEAIAKPKASYVLRDRRGDAVGRVARAKVFPQSCSPKWTYARSNGVAIHRSWHTACERALWELAERDRIVRSWRGEVAPRILAAGSAYGCARRTYEWVACSFPDPHSFAPEIEVVGVFAFPRSRSRSRRVPLALGFAGRPVLETALAAATSEAFQQLAFLWGEPLPTRIPKAPPSAGLHLDAFQVRTGQRRLRFWLEGTHCAFALPRLPSRKPARPPVRFVDLTAPWLEGRGFVAKAICAEAAPLVFGRDPNARHLPLELQLHPMA